MACIHKALPVMLAGLTVAAPQLASACETVTICLKWHPMLVDDAFGEEVSDDGGYAAARNAHVILVRPPPEPPLNRLLDGEGCMTFETQFAYGHKVVVYAEASVGTPPQRIRASRKEKSGGPSQLAMWHVDVVGLTPNDILLVPIVGVEPDPIAPIMAVATDVMHRFDQLGVLPPAGSQLLDILFKDYLAGAHSDDKFMELGPSSHNQKFVVAHEMGHWLSANWGVALGPGTAYEYGDPPSTPPAAPCRFAAGDVKDLYGNDIDANASSHGLRSAEWSSAAMSEGLAHFIASAAFNDISINDADGMFHYYKLIDKILFPDCADLVDNSYKVSLLGGPLGGQNSWTKNQCLSDFMADGVSSEIDWMRFYWRFLTKAGGSKPTLREILEFLAYATTDPGLEPEVFTKTNVWPLLRQSMDASVNYFQFVTRFEEANDIMGVYNDDTGT